MASEPESLADLGALLSATEQEMMGLPREELLKVMVDLKLTIPTRATLIASHVGGMAGVTTTFGEVERGVGEREGSGGDGATVSVGGSAHSQVLN
jgi:hypothetical protein